MSGCAGNSRRSVAHSEVMCVGLPRMPEVKLARLQAMSGPDSWSEPGPLIGWTLLLVSLLAPLGGRGGTACGLGFGLFARNVALCFGLVLLGLTLFDHVVATGDGSDGFLWSLPLTSSTTPLSPSAGPLFFSDMAFLSASNLRLQWVASTRVKSSQSGPDPNVELKVMIRRTSQW